jgi:hypothetical protein
VCTSILLGVETVSLAAQPRGVLLIIQQRTRAPCRRVSSHGEAAAEALVICARLHLGQDGVLDGRQKLTP